MIEKGERQRREGEEEGRKEVVKGREEKKEEGAVIYPSLCPQLFTFERLIRLVLLDKKDL